MLRFRLAFGSITDRDNQGEVTVQVSWIVIIKQGNT
jgi:hypothetical protein